VKYFDIYHKNFDLIIFNVYWYDRYNDLSSLVVFSFHNFRIIFHSDAGGALHFFSRKLLLVVFLTSKDAKPEYSSVLITPLLIRLQCSSEPAKAL
jgi:hypothetical protein